MVSPETVSLSTLERPMLIAVCKTSQFDYAEAKHLGT